MYENIKKYCSVEHCKICKYYPYIGKYNILGILIANKIDLTDRQVVTSEMGHKLADQLHLKYFECSAVSIRFLKINILPVIRSCVTILKISDQMFRYKGTPFE